MVALRPWMGLCVVLVACAGDDGSTGGGVTGIASLTGAVSASAADSGTDADSDPGSGSASSGDSGVGGDPECPFRDPAADEDDDGVANVDDGCPCAEDPLQRDFDGDGRGDACDNALLFAVTEGAAPLNLLQTTVRASVEAEILGKVVEASCEFAMPMLATGGEVLVRLGADDHAGLWLARLDFADSGVRECTIGAFGVDLVHLKVELVDLYIEGAAPYMVGFPFSPTDHAAGLLAGTIDGPQSIAIYGTFVVLESDNESLSMPGETYLSAVPGAFAPGEARVEGAGERFRATWSRPDFVVFDQVVSESGVRVRLTGMEGTLQLRR